MFSALLSNYVSFSFSYFLFCLVCLHLHCFRLPSLAVARLTIFPNQCAGLGRFLNGAKSSRDANVRVQRVLDADGRLHVLMITTRPVRKGEELKWPYGKNFPIDAQPASA